MIEEILKIEEPKNRQHIFWEHAMKSVFAALIAFVIMFSVPFLLIGKKNSSEWEQEKGQEALRYMDLHPAVMIGGCLLVVFIINLIIHLKTRKRKYVFEIRRSLQKIEFGISNLYYKKSELKSYEIESVKIIIISANTDLGKKSIVRFYNTEFNYIIGDIRVDHILFHQANRKILAAIAKLQKGGIEIEKRAGKSSNYGSSILRTITGWK